MDVEKFAKEQGFAGVRKIDPWRDFTCYEALMDTDNEIYPAIGFPQIILERSGVLRMAQYDEAMAYLDETFDGESED